MTINSEFSTAHLSDVLFQELQVDQNADLVLAFSGGCDSRVLLNCLAEIRTLTDISLTAAHFDHGIMDESREWVEFCRQVTDQLNIPFVTARKSVSCTPAISIEAAAREARYSWLATVAGPEQIVLTAHHADDQAESVLLALFQGKGFEQLGGIKRQRYLTHQSKTRLIRPLLGFRRNALESYARRNGMSWINDPSNDNTVYYRNYIRHKVMPKLENQWPNCVNQLNRLATGAQLVSAADHQRSLKLIENIGFPAKRSVFCITNPLKMKGMENLPQFELANLLKSWIHGSGIPLPGRDQFDAICEGIHQTQFSRSELAGNSIVMQSHGGRLYLYRQPGNVDSKFADWPMAFPSELPGTSIAVCTVSDDKSGFDADWLRSPNIRFRWRTGGERVHLPGRQHSSSLKKVLQMSGIPPWERATLPFVEVDGQIAWVKGIGAMSGFSVKEKSSGISIKFQAKAIETLAGI